MDTADAPLSAHHTPSSHRRDRGVLRLAPAWVAALLAVAIATLAACSPAGVAPGALGVERLRLATTTSMYHIGLWDVLEPIFEEEHGVDLLVLTGGTGQAIEAGKRGDVDVLTLHDEAREVAFVKDGFGVARYPIAYNSFIIVGPESDPAGIRGLQPEAALLRIMERGRADPEGVKFVSRGDGSGTHSREVLLWSQAGQDYEAVRMSGPWYLEAGAGMGAVLMMAYEKSAYTLAVSSTYEASRQKPALVPLVDRGDALLNLYSAIAVSPARHPAVNYAMAAKLVDFLSSDNIQDIIGEHGVCDYGAPLLVPARDWEPTGGARQDSGTGRPDLECPQE